MSKEPRPASSSMIIEIDDSSDDEPVHTSIPNNAKRKSTIAASDKIISEPQKESKEESANTLAEANKIIKQFDVPKKVVSRRKSVHHSIRSTENLSFECGPQKRRESVDDILSKRIRDNADEKIDDIIDQNLQDPEIERLLKKIAYCRVFSNYLLRQYDMLPIDFKLYSNLDVLNLDLKMRVDTYTAIKKSRQRFQKALDLNGQIQL